MKNLLLALTTMLTIPLYAGEYTEIRDLKLDTSGLGGFYADTGSGYLKVTGNDEISHIIVKATIQIDTKITFDDDDAQKYVSENLILQLTASGNKAKLNVNFKKGSWSLFKVNGRVDLDIQVPSSLYLEVDDGSGLITVTQMKNGVFVDDGSGSIELTDSMGKITIKDGSGALMVKNIQGDIFIDDGSGAIDVSQISGDISIDDGSGSIAITNITGSVKVDDGSGSVYLSGIDGNVRGYDEHKKRRSRDLK
ncbi:MAG: hypothetical protein COA74_08345 [Gammaproteobacteria bacterium]|nr:MAG: hypothetical protein COA74_08345 [Gammaproteobacteria bacterium]